MTPWLGTSVYGTLSGQNSCRGSAVVPVRISRAPLAGWPYGTGAHAAARRGPQSTLYLHGSADGCIGVDLVRDAGRYLGPDSAMKVIQGAGHFPHLERPAEVNQHILAW